VTADTGGPPRPGAPPTPPPDDGLPLAALAGLGSQFAVALVAFGYLGAWLDRRWDTAPLCLLVGVFAGGGGTFYTAYRRLMAQSAARARSTADAGAPRGDR
jgi:hypothetical protein